MPADKTCILFDGGKRIELAPDNAQGYGIKFTKDGQGNWELTLKTRILEMEAKNIIFKFGELDPQGKPFDDVFPNMAYFPAMDGNGQPKEIKLVPGSEIIPVFDRGNKGSITLKLQIADFGKTQNAKTQNATGGRPRRPSNG